MRSVVSGALFCLLIGVGSPPLAASQLKGAFPQKFLSPEATRLFTENFQLFGDYVTRKTGIGINISPLPDPDSVKRAFQRGEIDFFFGLSDLETLFFEGEGIGEPFLTVSPFRDLPNNTFRHLLIARDNPSSSKGWRLRHVEDYGERYKGITHLLAELLIREGLPMRLDRHDPRDEPPSRIQVVEYGQSRNLLLDALTDEKLAVLVDEEAYLMMKRRNPKVGETLKIIESLSPVPVAPLFVRRDLAGREKIKKCLLGMHRDPEGDEILKSLRLGKWVEVASRDFEELRRLVERARRLGIPLERGSYAARH